MSLPAKKVIELVKEQEHKFRSLDSANGALLDFEQECLFARQQILKNDYTLKIAGENPNSLQAAILNVAAIGISLNPASQHAYLVPRNGSICLDISYRGLVKLATETGAIKWAKVELVHENDTFEWNGPSTEPEHKADPFSDRGALKGGYCIAKLPDGDTLIEVMPIDEIHKIRDTSKAFQKKGGPWIDWYEEMVKKTILKRAYKSWPQTPNRRRVDEAVKVLHDTEGMAYTIEQHEKFMAIIQDEDAMAYHVMRCNTPENVWTALYNSFEDGQKVSNKKKANDLEKQGYELFQSLKQNIIEAAEQNDSFALNEALHGLNTQERDILFKILPAEAMQFIEETGKAA